MGTPITAERIFISIWRFLFLPLQDCWYVVVMLTRYCILHFLVIPPQSHFYRYQCDINFFLYTAFDSPLLQTVLPSFWAKFHLVIFLGQVLFFHLSRPSSILSSFSGKVPFLYLFRPSSILPSFLAKFYFVIVFWQSPFCHLFRARFANFMGMLHFSPRLHSWNDTNCAILGISKIL